MSEVLQLERAAVLASSSHLQDQLLDARHDTAQLRVQLEAQDKQLEEARRAKASRAADVDYRKKLQSRILMLETSACKSSSATVFCQGTLRLLETHSKVLNWVVRWVQLDNDALSFWDEEPVSEMQAPSSVFAVKQIASVAASTKQRFSFRISLNSGDPVYLEATSAQSCQDWIAAISSCRELCDDANIPSQSMPTVSDQEHILDLHQSIALLEAKMAHQRIVCERVLHEISYKFDTLLARSHQMDEDIWAWVSKVLRSDSEIDVGAPEPMSEHLRTIECQVDIDRVLKIGKQMESFDF